MDFVSKRKENYNTAQTTAMVDMDWRVSFPCPLIPKASLLQRLLSTFSDFNHRSLKKSSKPNCATSFHQNLSPQQPAERLVDAYRRVLQIKAHQACLDTPAFQKAYLDIF